MKKILLSFIAALFGFTLFAGTIDAPATISIQEMIMPDDYCPPGYICVATNKTAYGPNYGNGAKTIKGISVYRNDDKYVAYVPGHGHLELFPEREAGHYSFDTGDEIYQLTIRTN